MFGARPLKRFLQRELETRIARALLSGDIAARWLKRIWAGTNGFSGGSCARRMDNQETAVRLGCALLNQILAIAKPVS